MKKFNKEDELIQVLKNIVEKMKQDPRFGEGRDVFTSVAQARRRATFVKNHT